MSTLLNRVCSRHRCSLIQITLWTSSSISSAMSSLQPLTNSRHFVLLIASAVAVTSINFYHKRRPTPRDIEENSNAAGRRPVPKLIDSLIDNNVSWLTILQSDCEKDHFAKEIADMNAGSKQRWSAVNELLSRDRSSHPQSREICLPSHRKVS